MGKQLHKVLQMKYRIADFEKLKFGKKRCDDGLSSNQWIKPKDA